MNQKELDTVLEQHRLWLSTEGRSGQRADLRKADLREADLRKANLRGANLGRANLGRANLRGADLHGANLHGANLHGANLYGAYLQNANLTGADLRRAQFTLEIKGCHGFHSALVSEDQLVWLCLHPGFGDMSKTLRMTS